MKNLIRGFIVTILSMAYIHYVEGCFHGGIYTWLFLFCMTIVCGVLFEFQYSGDE